MSRAILTHRHTATTSNSSIYSPTIVKTNSSSPSSSFLVSSNHSSNSLSNNNISNNNLIALSLSDTLNNAMQDNLTIPAASPPPAPVSRRVASGTHRQLVARNTSGGSNNNNSNNRKSSYSRSSSNDDSTMYMNGSLPNNSKNNSCQGFVRFITAVIVGAVTMYTVIKYFDLPVQHSQFVETRLELEQLRIQLQSTEHIRKDMESDNSYLKERLKTAETARADAQDERDQIERTYKDKADTMEKSIAYFKKYTSRIHSSIQAMAKQRVLEQFGPGPHLVEVIVDFSPHSPLRRDQEADNRIVLELAPLDDMPLANFWFLNQVTHGLYDGCSFHRNAGHVIQGGPAGNHLSDQKSGQLDAKFRHAGLHGILFQEYSDKFPHLKYTVGYAGRPGGPDFYISMQDNSRIHGPGGQRSYEDPNEADVCFAKVVEGTTVADRIHQSDVQPGGYKHMVQNVGIVRMSLIKQV